MRGKQSHAQMGHVVIEAYYQFTKLYHYIIDQSPARGVILQIIIPH